MDTNVYYSFQNASTTMCSWTPVGMEVKEQGNFTMYSIVLRKFHFVHVRLRKVGRRLSAIFLYRLKSLPTNLPRGRYKQDETTKI